jgi:hypothetical protein
MSLTYCGLDRAACASSGPDPIVRSWASLRAADSFFRYRARSRMPSLSHSSPHGPTFAVSRPRLPLAAGYSQYDDYGMPCHWPFRRSRSSSRHGGIARFVVPAMPVLGFAGSSSSTIVRSDFALLSISLSSPSGLALARAETLRPAPAAVLLRATTARPAGFGSPGNISYLSQPRLAEILPVPPKKHAPRLGSSSLSLSVCPSQTGRKGVTDACISIA